MNQYLNFSKMLGSLVDNSNIKIDEPMSNHTSFKVGGPVDILVTPESEEQVLKIVNACKGQKIPYYVIGNGSNLLVKDGGIRGVVIKLSKLSHIEVKGEYLIAECGAELSEITKIALKNFLTGFEFACGIPGSIGGAVAMNAGAYNGEISNVIESTKIIDDQGNIRTLDKNGLELGYRMSSVLKYGYVVLAVTLKLIKGDFEKIHTRIEDLNRRRNDKQPLEFPSAGSTFKRPEGHFAAKLIEDSGLKGICVGDAQVSKKHSGFIINKGNASSKDILDLIKMVQDTVKDLHSIDLHTEVRILGEDKPKN